MLLLTKILLYFGNNVLSFILSIFIKINLNDIFNYMNLIDNNNKFYKTKIVNFSRENYGNLI